MELALLFPNGRTQHVPDDGGPITPEDVRRARAANSEVAQQIAEFHEQRDASQGADPGCVAGAVAAAAAHAAAAGGAAGAPRHAPDATASGQRLRRWRTSRCRGSSSLRRRRAARGGRPSRRGSGEMRVAAADPGAGAALDRLKWGASLSRETTFVPAPAYDEEHPEELSYRPFPIAPFLTATASADDPALARMVHPDLNKTLEMLDQASSIAADAAAARLADGAAHVGAAVQGRGDQPVEPRSTSAPPSAPGQARRSQGADAGRNKFAAPSLNAKGPAPRREPALILGLRYRGSALRLLRSGRRSLTLRPGRSPPGDCAARA